MTRTDNAIVIDAPMDLVWSMTNDVESWPELFTEYASAEILARDAETVRFRLTTRPKGAGAPMSWVSERTPDISTRTVRARRIETGPFEHMDITWEYREVDGGVAMRWVQDFAVRADFPLDEATMAQYLTDSAKEQMAHIKGVVERAWETAAAHGS